MPNHLAQVFHHLMLASYIIGYTLHPLNLGPLLIGYQSWVGTCTETVQMFLFLMLSLGTTRFIQDKPKSYFVDRASYILIES